MTLAPHAGSRHRPHAQAPVREGRKNRGHATAAAGHASWCVQHVASGCQGQVFRMPGTQLLVWLTAPTAGDPRLVVEGPDGLVELPVDA